MQSSSLLGVLLFPFALVVGVLQSIFFGSDFAFRFGILLAAKVVINQRNLILHKLSMTNSYQ
jgi:hypothetical protein